MPTKLEEGIVIFNATKHGLYFQTGDGSIVYAPVDETINAASESKRVRLTGCVEYVNVRYKPTSFGDLQVNRIHRQYPGVIIIGSNLAARAYPGKVFSPIPKKAERENYNRILLNVHNRFNTHEGD